MLLNFNPNFNFAIVKSAQSLTRIAVNKMVVIAFSAGVSISCFSQSIGTFSSVTPTTQVQTLVLPSTHTFQRIIRTGDALSLGGTLGSNTDFTGYVPIGGSSKNGYLSISSETTPAAVGILNISYTAATHRWNVNSGGNVNFLTNATFGATSRFCSGTVTPNNTVIVCEEDITAGDANGDGYQDRGWLIEIDPVTRTVINQDGIGVPDRLWAIGRAQHENAAIKSDNSVLYTGVDNGTNGYLYKFIPTVPGNFSSGTLYVLQTTAALGNATWRIVANTTQSDRNNKLSLSTAAGAYNFNGVEDIEFGPDGKMYFAAKAQGKVYRFTDNGTYGTATDVTGLEVFVGNSNFPTRVSYDIDGPGALPLEPWGLGNDNLAFDADGNLWVLQDAIEAADRNHIWVVSPTHTQASPQVKVFATTPLGSEPTGITFTPDHRFLFMSFMHPNTTNTGAQVDAAGNSVVFNTHTTVVIARRENLGPTATLPLSFIDFNATATKNNTVELKWTVEDAFNHDYFSIERSTDGIHFNEILKNTDKVAASGKSSFGIIDENPTNSATVYYRIRQCNINGECSYSATKAVNFTALNNKMKITPLPVKENMNITYSSFEAGQGALKISNVFGQVLMQQNILLKKGSQQISVNTGNLTKGEYFIIITDKDGKNTTGKFIKI